MKVKDLIYILGKYDPEEEVTAANEGNAANSDYEVCKVLGFGNPIIVVRSLEK